MKTFKLSSSAAAQTVPKWKKPPPPGFIIKCNLDASVSQSLDANGDFIASHSIRLPGLFSAREAEAMCLLEALQWVNFFCMEKVFFDTDAKATVDVIFFPQEGPI